MLQPHCNWSKRMQYANKEEQKSESEASAPAPAAAPALWSQLINRRLASKLPASWHARQTAEVPVFILPLLLEQAMIPVIMGIIGEMQAVRWIEQRWLHPSPCGGSSLIRSKAVLYNSALFFEPVLNFFEGSQNFELLGLLLLSILVALLGCGLLGFPVTLLAEVVLSIRIESFSSCFVWETLVCLYMTQKYLKLNAYS